VAGNPVLSAPNGRLLDRALASLELLVAIDIYVNETTRHAHLILPPAWSLERDGYEALLHLLAVRNTAKVSPRVLDPSPGAREDWRILGDLALALAAARRPGSPGGRLASAARRRGWLPSPNRLLDVLIRTGPHGDRFLPGSRGLSLERVARSPHGVDLGPLEPRLQRLLCTDSGTIELGHPTIAGELRALADRLASPARGREGDELLLIGRRDVRTNNSWLHNAPSMVTGKERCTLLMHPDDARRLGLSSGERVAIRSRVGEVVAPLEVTAEIMPGVVSLPHGWGHEREGVRMRVARAHPGVSANDLTDERVVERVVGQAVLNGVPVAVRAAGSPVQ
jgi:anaerobic selenocysteine-containing dehydrogenase